MRQCIELHKSSNVDKKNYMLDNAHRFCYVILMNNYEFLNWSNSCRLKIFFAPAGSRMEIQNSDDVFSIDEG